MNSTFGSLNWKDLGKGVLVAVLTVIVSGIMTSLDAGTLPTLESLKPLLLAGLGAGLAYLLKNVFQNSNGQLGTEK